MVGQKAFIDICAKDSRPEVRLPSTIARILAAARRENVDEHSPIILVADGASHHVEPFLTSVANRNFS